MKKFSNAISFMGVFSMIFGMILGCGESAKTPQWTKAKKIAGKEQRLSHISSMVVDEKHACVWRNGR